MAVEGDLHLVIGTHALIQKGVEFRKLGLVVVDEQHRFGVLQRSALRQKGRNPHVLVMTATPIPRTLALTLYGDLDLSVIDELPPGRVAIQTKWLEPQQRQAAYDFVRRQVGEGRQAFVVCPLIEESENIEAKAAVAEYHRLSREVFPDLRLGLLHGRMSAADKEAVMRSFKDGELDILVSTPVVEVGIDVPERRGDAHRGRRPLRPVAAPPVPRQGGPGGAPELLPAAGGVPFLRRPGAAEDHRAHPRWFPPGGGGPAAARPR